MCFERDVIMTWTIQPRSAVSVNNIGKTLHKFESPADDNMRLLLSVFEGLNHLNEKLSRLDYLIQRKSIEKIICQKGKGEKNED